MKLILIAIGLLISTFSFSFEKKRGNYTRIEINSLQNGSYQLDFHSHAATLLRIEIYDERGSFVFTDKVGIRRSFVKNYNFSNLPSGNYTINLFSNREKLTKQFYHKQIDTRQLKFAADIYKIDNEKAYELILSSESNLPAWVYIFDSNEKLVHKEEIQVNKNFTKTYYLSAIRSDDFSFVVKTNDSSFRPKEMSKKKSNELYSSTY